jgi:hypothetical protein
MKRGRAALQGRVLGQRTGALAPEKRSDGKPAGSYSVITVDCPEISNLLRQRMFLQAIMSSFRTI